MHLFRRIERLYHTFRPRVLKLWEDIKQTWDLYEFLVNYVPKYRSRTSKQHQDIRDRIKQDPSTCRHRKGGGICYFADYNISDHRFIDGSRRVRCLSCGKIWWAGTPEWEEAKAMLESTSNRWSSSEIVDISGVDNRPDWFRR